jgi:Flp pilus assembly protein protease CpaA
MTTIPIPLTKATLIALGICFVLLVVGKFVWALFFAFGWTLGGDGKVFTHVRGLVTEWRKSRPTAAS